MKKYRIRKEKKEQYKNMLIGAAICLSITLMANKSNKVLNTVEAYTEDAQQATIQELSKEELMQRELNYVKAEQDIFKPVYMSTDMMIELGAEVGDTIEIPNHGIATVRNIDSMRENAIILFNDEIELNGGDIELYKYTTTGGN